MARPVPAPLVAQVRAFNRFYTRRIGSLDRSYLGTALTLPEARVLYEVATADGCTATEVRARTGIDQGYLSRTLARLQAAGLVRAVPSDRDGRARRLRLTPKGTRTFAAMDARADEQAAELLSGLGTDDRRRAAQAIGTLQALLDGAADAPLRLRSERVGDLAWAFHRQAIVYEQEFGYSSLFQTYVAEGLPPYLANHDPKRDRLWVAELGGAPVGVVAVHHVDDRPGWAKLRWFLVEREARGRGVGTLLLDTAVAFARRAGYKGLFLWTVSDLHAARALYERAGFTLAEETDGCAWAPWAHEQRWEMALGLRRR